METINKELTDEQYKKLSDIYFYRHAKNNEDFDGCEMWVEDLSVERITELLSDKEIVK